MSLEDLRGKLKARRELLSGLKVAVLAGGSSAEREVSLVSGQAVADVLASAGYQPELLKLNPDNLHSVLAQLPEVGMIFTTLHGTRGEDGVWQGVFELLNIPYVSAGVKGSSLAMDKLISKRLFQQMGIPTPQYWAVRNGEDKRGCVPAYLQRLVAKPACEGSSVGIAMVDNNDAGWAVIEELAQKYDPLLIEERIAGRELTCSVIGPCTDPSALPLVEIQPTREFYDYDAKYTKGSSNYVCPAELNKAVSDKIQAHSVRIYREFELEPYARVDCLLDKNDVPWFLEANTLPGFTELSLVPMAAQAAGVSFAELCELLMLCALERWEARQGREASHA